MRRALVRATAGLSTVMAAGAEAENTRAGLHLFIRTTMLTRVKVGLMPSLGTLVLVELVGVRRRFKKC
jgi:hypothetical protein